VRRGRQRAVGGTRDVGADERFVQWWREAREHRCVVRDQPEELRTPGGDRHDVDQREGPVPRPVEQMSAQRGRSAVIMSDEVGWLLELPVLEEVGEYLSLDGQGDVLLLDHRRGAVAEHVPEMDGEVLGQRLGDRLPQCRRPRGPMAEDDGRAGSAPRPAHGLPVPVHGLLEHGESLSAPGWGRPASTRAAASSRARSSSARSLVPSSLFSTRLSGVHFMVDL